MTSAEVRIGLVGYGFGGRHFHAPLIASVAGCVLAGVVTRSPVRRAEVAEDHPGVPVFDSVAGLIEASRRRRRCVYAGGKAYGGNRRDRPAGDSGGL